MATLNLGRIKPVFRGAYAGGTAYVIDDIVTSGNETFICIQASTGNATSNASYWTKLAAKGVDGTDVGTTITTQGDLLYRDGSGLQRLAKGTASQVLKMNTAANAPEWGNLSSDYVKISESTTSGTPAALEFKTTAQSGELDFSTYSRYEIYMDYVTHTASSNDYSNLHLRYLDNSGNTLSGGSYFFINNAGGISGSSDNGARNQSEIRLTRDYIGKQSGRSQMIHLTLHDMTNTSYDKNIFCRCYGNNHDGSGGTPRQDITGGFYASTSAMSGVRVYFSDGNFVNGIKIRTYGVK